MLVMGLRRVGKTTLFYQLIQELLNRGVEPTKILYFSFDEEPADIDDLLKTYREKVLKAEFENTRIYIFLDEIQKAKDWQNKLKIYYDIYPELKFFISGSASVSLQKKSKESLAGRIYDFILPQLSFDEFLDLKGMKVELEKVELYRDKILPHFFDYLRKGGFPEITHLDDDEKIKSYIKNSVIERIIYRDLPVEFGLKDIELLNILIRMVAESPGMVLNYDSLSRDLKRSKTTIINYISYLEYALILRLVYNYRKGFVSSSRKLRKIYLTNVSISFALVPHFYTEKFLEKVVENLVINKFNAKNYYRNNYEIDAVIKTSKGILPVEVKYGKIEAKKY
ncbi:MAG: ATP-binding protein [Candidatus Thermoplasmatota archaeon]|nr:ATP-binding protein [Candidatus Thermoplasmatota archaeon]